LTVVSNTAYSCGSGTTSGTRRDVTTWKQRLAAAEEAQRTAYSAYQQATEERAQALLDGVAELGTQAEVARELGITRASVNQAIKAWQKKQEGPPE
jgi:hypothetical protein